jgi:rSAM/selenodomain-associated transferase 2
VAQGAHKLSVIVPVLNDAIALALLANDLKLLRAQGHEIIVVDGGSDDCSMEVAKTIASSVVSSEPGRALQMHVGAQRAVNDILWFVHADSRLLANSENSLINVFKSTQGDLVWGRFNACSDNTKVLLRMVVMLMNWRSCLSGIATGDQGIFVGKKLYFDSGGFPQIPLMEDIALSKSLNLFCKPTCLKQKIIISMRRWEDNGALKTIFLMWIMRFAYAFGVNPTILHAWYYEKK